MRTGSATILLALLALSPARAGDADFARFLFEKAEKEFRAREYEGAEKDYRRALDELSPFPEAAFGLGETLEKLDRTLAAVEAYRRCIDQVETSDKPPSAWKRLASRAKRAITRLRRRFAALDRLDRDFVLRCIDFGRRYGDTSPDCAREALEAALRVDPGNATAKELLKFLAPSFRPNPPAPPEEPPPEARRLFADDLANWGPGRTEEWSLTAGVVRGDIRGPQGRLNWLEDPVLKGKYTVTVRFRVVRLGGPKRTFGLFLGGDGKKRWWPLLFTWNDELILDFFDRGRPTPKKQHLLRGFDRTEWHRMRIVITPGFLTAFLDDEEVLSYAADDREAFDGMLALFAQDIGVEFADLELREP